MLANLSLYTWDAKGENVLRSQRRLLRSANVLPDEETSLDVSLSLCPPLSPLWGPEAGLPSLDPTILAVRGVRPGVQGGDKQAAPGSGAVPGTVGGAPSWRVASRDRLHGGLCKPRWALLSKLDLQYTHLGQGLKSGTCSRHEKQALYHQVRNLYMTLLLPFLRTGPQLTEDSIGWGTQSLTGHQILFVTSDGHTSF